MRRLATLALCLGLLAGGCTSPPPAGVLSGRIDATATGDVAADAAVAVEPADATPASAALRDLLVDELAAHGIRVVADAALVVSYRAAVTPARSRLGVPEVGLAGVIGSSGTRDVGVSVGLPIFGLGDRALGRHRYALEVALTEREGHRLWHGYATGIAGTGDIAAIAPTVLPVLLDQFGRTVRGLDVPIRPR